MDGVGFSTAACSWATGVIGDGLSFGTIAFVVAETLAALGVVATTFGVLCGLEPLVSFLYGAIS